MGAAETSERLREQHNKGFMPKVHRGHEFNLAVDPLPALPFFAQQPEILPRLWRS